MKRQIQDRYGNWNWEKISSPIVFNLPDTIKLFTVDWQLGHEDVHPQTLRNLVDYVLGEPDIYVVLQDFIDAQWLSKYAHLDFSTKTPENEELTRLEEHLRILEPIYHRFLMQIGSNHIDRFFGLNQPVERSQVARSNFNVIYGRIFEKNPDFLMINTVEVPTFLKFPTKQSLKLMFLHPSRLGSSRTAESRASEFYGYYGLVVGHTHGNIQVTYKPRMGQELRVWFASHLFSRQPEYEKQRMGRDEPSKPLVLGWKKGWNSKTLKIEDVFDRVM